MKIVIAALREGRKTWSELQKLGIPEKTLATILKEYLIPFGLVEKDGDYYVWYDLSRVLTPLELERAMRHSLQLIPAFESLRDFGLRIVEPNVFATNVEPHLVKAALEHLRSYPNIFQKISNPNYVRIADLIGKYHDKVMIKFGDTVKSKRKGLLGKIGVSKTEFKLRDVPWTIVSEESENTQENKELKEFQNYLMDKKLFNEMITNHHDFVADISELIVKTKSGEPLEGKCSLCPKVTIYEKPDKTA